ERRKEGERERERETEGEKKRQREERDRGRERERERERRRKDWSRERRREKERLEQREEKKREREFAEDQCTRLDIFAVSITGRISFRWRGGMRVEEEMEVYLETPPPPAFPQDCPGPDAAT
ncbi:putative uncharacterized protein DDB_G0271982, partial [Boleophthalmus pectinirostris]|uniref:putative uncharacterized protein DDB_G0271982 n=1 Tax=Boleophthalmus pectinirostris TaxID=150288 RepID=UPI002430ACDA